MTIKTENIEKLVDKNLALTGRRRDTFLKQAHALRHNLDLRKKQQEQKKGSLCSPMHSK